MKQVLTMCFLLLLVKMFVLFHPLCLYMLLLLHLFHHFSPLDWSRIWDLIPSLAWFSEMHAGRKLAEKKWQYLIGNLTALLQRHGLISHSLPIFAGKKISGLVRGKTMRNLCTFVPSKCTGSHRISHHWEEWLMKEGPSVSYDLAHILLFLCCLKRQFAWLRVYILKYIT